jgi:hypothetical protein
MTRWIRLLLFLGVVLPSLFNLSEGQVQPAVGLTIQKSVAVGTKKCDVVTWTDANGKQRSVSFVRADGDHAKFQGGYVQRYTYYVGETMKTGLAWDASQENVSGLGCAVNHHKGASSSKSDSTDATTGFVFEGANHCLWRFRSKFSGAGQTVGLTIDWLISQGRNDVLWAVSYDCTGNPTFNWDARGPYFQFDWDGDGKFYEGPISGIRWGDHYKFRTTTFSGAASAWDYSQPNVIPYMALHKDASIGDVESGVVQTQPWTSQDAGGYWWAQGHWGKTGTGMMENWNCPFQLNAYEGYSSEKMAWGTNFGYVGNAAYARLDNKPQVGAPHQGYSTYIILNRYSDGLTEAMISSLETVQRTALSATKGTVVAAGPRHANLAGDGAYQPAGWNHVYGAWSVNLDGSNAASLNLAIDSGTLLRPLLVFNNCSGPKMPVLTLNGIALAPGRDYAASLDSAGRKLWVTLMRNLTGKVNALTLN